MVDVRVVGKAIALAFVPVVAWFIVLADDRVLARAIVLVYVWFVAR